MTVARVLYLHGFASSARSSKATFFARRLAAEGIPCDVPDLNDPDFSTLTISRMVRQAGAIVTASEGGAVAVIGSSLGGFVAVQTALAHPDRVRRLVLCAPALDLGGNRMGDLGDRGIDEWKATNQLDVFHHAYGRMMQVHYDLYADALRFDALDARLEIPVQVFQGRRDTAVDPGTVERWSHARPNVELHMLDDDHQLAASLETIWPQVRRFLGIGSA